MTRITQPNQEVDEAEPKNHCNTPNIAQDHRDNHSTIYNNHDDGSDNYSDNQEGDEQTYRPVAEILALTSAANRLTIAKDYDLRPKFAILKHKAEILKSSHSSTTTTTPSDQENKTQRTYPKTPDWFFNIPTTRSPFPSFATQSSDDNDD